MIRHKLNSKSIYLMCTLIKSSSKVTMNVKTDITIIKCASVHKFTNNIPDSTMLNLENYGEIFHNHQNCQEIRNAGTCRMTRYEEHCFKKDVKTQSAIRNPSTLSTGVYSGTFFSLWSVFICL